MISMIKYFISTVANSSYHFVEYDWLELVVVVSSEFGHLDILRSSSSAAESEKILLLEV